MHWQKNTVDISSTQFLFEHICGTCSLFEKQVVWQEVTCCFLKTGKNSSCLLGKRFYLDLLCTSRPILWASCFMLVAWCLLLKGDTSCLLVSPPVWAMLLMQLIGRQGRLQKGLMVMRCGYWVIVLSVADLQPKQFWTGREFAWIWSHSGLKRWGWDNSSHMLDQAYLGWRYSFWLILSCFTVKKSRTLEKDPKKSKVTTLQNFLRNALAVVFPFLSLVCFPDSNRWFLQ